jgi:hypothetical protein
VGSVPSALLRGPEWTHIPADLAVAAYAMTDRHPSVRVPAQPIEQRRDLARGEVDLHEAT